MTVTGTPVYLFNVERGEQEDAELWDGITEQNLADWEGEWVPEQFKAVQRLHRSGVERRFWPQSLHWDWRDKINKLQKMLAHPSFSIVCGGVTQGMMFIDTTMRRCQIDSQRDKDLVYVSFVENAPWNRRELFDPPRYRGIGSILIRAAIARSHEEGFKGRIGLHSLPQANNFYGNTCGMTDLGVDPNYEGLRYFEMTPEQAEAFIEKGHQL
jgi:hypothetical protein